MENLNIALLLMVVGMATVFAILLIVIYLGKCLIALVKQILHPKKWYRPKLQQMVLHLSPVIFWQLSVQP